MNGLKFYRLSKQYTLRSLSAASTVNPTRIHHAEHGRQLTTDEYERLAAVLGCPADVLPLPVTANPVRSVGAVHV